MGVNFGLSHHYCIIADDMGLGKTLEALAICAASKLRTIAIVPAYLKQNWKAEVLKFTKLKPQVIDTSKLVKSQVIDTANSI